MTSIETIEKSFPPVNNIISEYNHPIYLVSIHCTSIELQDEKYNDSWMNKIFFKKQSAIDFLVDGLQFFFNSIYYVVPEEIKDEKMKQKISKYMEENNKNIYTGKIGEDLYSYIKNEHKNEESLKEILSIINELENRENRYAFIIDERHIE